jgi:hypothetical protein
MLTTNDQLEMASLIQTVQHNQETADYAARLVKAQELNQLLTAVSLVLCVVVFVASCAGVLRIVLRRTKRRHGRRVTA